LIFIASIHTRIRKEKTNKRRHCAESMYILSRGIQARCWICFALQAVLVLVTRLTKWSMRSVFVNAV